MHAHTWILTSKILKNSKISFNNVWEMKKMTFKFNELLIKEP